MTRTTLVRIWIAIAIALLLASASVILIRTNGGAAAPRAQTPGSFVH